MATRPNIFQIATKELTQDGFFTWLLQWADTNNAAYDKDLNALAQDFVMLLISKKYDLTDLSIGKVEARRQVDNIDIVAEVNDEYAIIVEDKSNSPEHGDQLDRYEQSAIKKYKGYKLVLIYLKTGNESSATQEGVRQKRWAVVGREEILRVLTVRQSQNEILNDFISYLTSIETQTKAFLNKSTTDWLAAQGLFLKLEEFNTGRYPKTAIGDWGSQVGDWDYVPNRGGGFLGFWYHFRLNSTKEFKVYIQIENLLGKKIRLVVKVRDWEANVPRLHEILAQLQPIAQRHGLTLSKPFRFKTGETSTVAVVKDVFHDRTAGTLNFDRLLEIMMTLEKIVDEYCQTASETQKS
jgi:PD-(D/E)XK nuclease superfamily